MSSKQKRFDALVNALYSDLYRYAYWICNNASVAEDLVQETYLRAWKSFDYLKDEKAAKAWLITILRRENARLHERYKPELLDIDYIHLEDTAISPGQLTENNMLQKAILQLDMEFREPVILQVLGGFDTSEISDILELNKNTVLTRLFRGRKKLKQAFDKKLVSGSKKNG